jgi:hypothetical protein
MKEVGILLSPSLPMHSAFCNDILFSIVLLVQLQYFQICRFFSYNCDYFTTTFNHSGCGLISTIMICYGRELIVALEIVVKGYWHHCWSLAHLVTHLGDPFWAHLDGSSRLCILHSSALWGWQRLGAYFLHNCRKTSFFSEGTLLTDTLVHHLLPCWEADRSRRHEMCFLGRPVSSLQCESLHLSFELHWWIWQVVEVGGVWGHLYHVIFLQRAVLLTVSVVVSHSSDPF